MSFVSSSIQHSRSYKPAKSYDNWRTRAAVLPRQKTKEAAVKMMMMVLQL